MSRTPYVSRAAQIARGQPVVRGAPLVPPPPHSDDYDELHDRRPEVVTESATHAHARSNERIFSDKSSPPAGTRLDSDHRYAEGNSGLAAPPTKAAPLPRSLSDKFADWFHYETVQIVKIANKKTAVIFHAFQLAILAYIVGFGLIYKKGYQATDVASGNSMSKLKGVAYANGTLPWLGPNATSSFQVYDAYDLVQPVLEADAFFVTTQKWVTLGQTRGKCVSFDPVTNSCPCTALQMTRDGVQVGPDHCMVNSTDPRQPWPTPMGSFCLLNTWCPTEQELTGNLNTFRLHGVDNFTLYVRMTVHYSIFGEVLDNSNGKDQLQTGLNSWTLKEIVKLTGYNWKDINATGVLIALDSNWDCDFDKHTAAECLPAITFKRLDKPNSKLSVGYNFRTAEYTHDAAGSRELTKRYGLRLLITMQGVGARFDWAALLTAIGAGIGLMTVATLAADFIATKLLKEKPRIINAKFKEVVIKDPHSHGFIHSLTHVGHSHAAGERSSSDEEEEEQERGTEDSRRT